MWLPPIRRSPTWPAVAGKKVAATKGTDPYFFLLQTLNAHGLAQKDVEVINLQHADGKTALERGDVDAWAGLDPHMAQTELEQGSKLIYRNIDFNTYGFLNARQKFLEEYAAYVPRVLTQYERARHGSSTTRTKPPRSWPKRHSSRSKSRKKELVERTVLTISPVPGDDQTAALTPVIPIFEAENQLTPGADANEALANLYAPEWIQAIVDAAPAS